MWFPAYLMVMLAHGGGSGKPLSRGWATLLSAVLVVFALYNALDLFRPPERRRRWGKRGRGPLRSRFAVVASTLCVLSVAAWISAPAYGWDPSGRYTNWLFGGSIVVVVVAMIVDDVSERRARKAGHITR